MVYAEFNINGKNESVKESMYIKIYVGKYEHVIQMFKYLWHEVNASLRVIKQIY